MGRPINKRFLGDGPGRIAVTNYRLQAGAEEIAGDDVFIVSQRSTNKFLISREETFSEVLTLVNKNAGALDAGEFRIETVTSDGVVRNIIRLYNRTVRTSSAQGPTKTAYDITIPTLDIAAISQDTVAEITLAADYALVTGDVVYINGGDMTDITGAHAITVTGTDTFTVIVDSTGFDAYTADGYISGIGAYGTGIDTQTT